MKKILVLGATGSIGSSALDVIEHNSSLFVLAGMSAHKNTDKLAALGKKFNCTNLCITSEAAQTHREIPLYGERGLDELIRTTDCDIVLNGIAGAAGLKPSIAALESGKDLALANKETIVMAGLLIKKLAAAHHCRILPVDSEHSAVFNLIERYGKDAIDTIVLTASGGPFRTLSAEKLPLVTVADTLKHPTWSMGQKITIDSASLANKGLEVIEACRLFDTPAEKVQVVVHPQSLIHSLIRTKDGVLYAQISQPDMRHPILSALTWPDVQKNHLEPFDLCSCAEMTFAKPRMNDFKMLPLAYEAAKKSGLYTIAYNAANEVAVASFIQGQISFTGIAELTEAVLQQDWTEEPKTFDAVFAADAHARKCATAVLTAQKG